MKCHACRKDFCWRCMTKKEDNVLFGVPHSKFRSLKHNRGKLALGAVAAPVVVPLAIVAAPVALPLAAYKSPHRIDLKVRFLHQAVLCMHICANQVAALACSPISAAMALALALPVVCVAAAVAIPAVPAVAAANAVRNRRRKRDRDLRANTHRDLYGHAMAVAASQRAGHEDLPRQRLSPVHRVRIHPLLMAMHKLIQLAFLAE